MPVRKAGNFWLTIHDNHRSRQYRRKVIKITDDPLTDREETIGLLCAEVEQLQAELAREKKGSDLLEKIIEDQKNTYVGSKKYWEDKINQLQEENMLLREILESIKNGGDWLTELNNNQDPSFPTMTLAYAKDCYRNAKRAVRKYKEKV